MINENLPTVSIVIPTYNRKDKLQRLLDSIVKSEYPKDRLEIIVVVDADGIDYTDLTNKYPNVKFIYNPKEKLLAESRNIGIKKSQGEYILIIDDDNVIHERCIYELVKFMKDNPNVGIVGPVMYYYKQPQRVWCAGVKRNYYTSLTTFIGRDTIDTGQFVEPIPSEDFPNAFMVKREVIQKIGYFDSHNFPIHYDEADFCRRASQEGFKIYTIPTAKVWHDIPLPEEIKDKARAFHVHNELRAYYNSRNRIVFHKKYSKKHQWLFFIGVFNWLITAYYLYVILFGSKYNIRRRLKIMRSYLRGVWEGIKWKESY